MTTGCTNEPINETGEPQSNNSVTTDDSMEELPPLIADDDDDKDNNSNENFEPRKQDPPNDDSIMEELPPLIADDDDDNDDVVTATFSIKEKVNKQSYESSIGNMKQAACDNNSSQKCFGPCGSKVCKPPQQWEVCSNSKNSFIKCSNIIGEQCHKKYGGLCRICIIAGGTTTRR